jgi:hypothetical protein
MSVRPSGGAPIVDAMRAMTPKLRAVRNGQADSEIIVTTARRRA